MKALARWTIRFAAALGILLIVVSVTPVLKWWTSALSANWGDESGDVLIVLGGDNNGTDVIGMSSYWRAYYAVLEWRAHHYRTIVIAGKGAAPLMRDFVVSQGVPAAVVKVEDQSASTRENAQNVSALLKQDPGRKVLLTSDFHMGRALRVFRRAGINASPIPIPDVRKRTSDPVQCWALFCNLFQETAKVIGYRARGWI